MAQNNNQRNYQSFGRPSTFFTREGFEDFVAYERVFVLDNGNHWHVSHVEFLGELNVPSLEQADQLLRDICENNTDNTFYYYRVHDLGWYGGVMLPATNTNN